MKYSSLHLICLNILGWSSYACADILGKYLSSDYHISQLLMVASGIAFVVLAAWIFIKRGLKGFTSPKLKWHLLRAVGVCGVSYCVVSAFSRIPLADFYGISFTAPFVILIAIAIFLKEHIGRHRWCAVIVGFVGVLILAGPQFANFSPGYIFAVAAVFLITFTAIIIRKIGRDEYLPLYGVYPPLIITLFNAPMAFQNYTPIALTDYILFALYGGFVIGGLLMTTYSIAKIKEMAITAPFQYIQIVWGVVFGYVLFGDIPAPSTYLGLSLIIGAGLYMIYREYRNHHPENFNH